MPRSDDLMKLPEGLPAPADDGACRHLAGMRVPPLPLPSTRGGRVDLSRLAGRTVVYIYPRTGDPRKEPIPGWDQIPGARGCTPQSCAFRDHHAELTALGAQVYGLSAQGTADQQEAAERLRLPFPLLSDEGLAFARALSERIEQADPEAFTTRFRKRGREHKSNKRESAQHCGASCENGQMNDTHVFAPGLRLSTSEGRRTRRKFVRLDGGSARSRRICSRSARSDSRRRACEDRLRFFLLCIEGSSQHG